ncbi:MAG: DUF349 domain-containing protein, partial [Clostridiales bacterium]
MEPKDLKNSEVELSGAQAEPETNDDRTVTELTEEKNEVTEPQEAAEPAVAETVETPSEEPVSGVEASKDEEIVDKEVSEPVLEQPEQVQENASAPPAEAEIPTIEELIGLSEDVDPDEVQEDELQEEGKKAKLADYADLNETELLNSLRELLKNEDVDSAKDDIDAIKIYFFRLYRANIEAQKAAFIEAGGNPEEFKAESDPVELEFRILLKQYQDLRSEHNRKIDEIKEINLQKKYEIIEEIKALINNKESINRTFHEFRELQNRWREIGLVPQAKIKDLWETYHHHVENFYDFIKINKELRDLDLKKNLESKMEICEKTEELLVEPSIIKAFNILQKYHEQWREVGPVPRDKKDEIWERFKAATSIINKKHQDYFESRKSDQKKNLEAKIALCEKVEE